MRSNRPKQNEFETYFFHHSNQETADYFGVCTYTIFNWARFYGTRRKCSRHRDEEILSLKLTELQSEVVTGSLLGDGSLGKVSKVKGDQHSYYRELHGLKQEDYIKWKHDLLQPFAGNFRKCKNNRIYEAFKFHTIRHPIFTELEKEWYLRDDSGEYILRNGKRIKVLPKKLELTSLTVAVWYVSLDY